MKQAYLVYNPDSGNFPSQILAEQAAEILSQSGWQLQVRETESGEHITKLAAQAAQQDMQVFFIMGGDGSVNLALPGLIGSNTALGVLPSGTANVWAQELGLSGLSWSRWDAISESAQRLAQAEVRSVDVGMCNGKPFLLWAGVGLDAFIVHRIEPRSKWEKQFSVMQYTASAFWNAGFWRGMNLRVEVNKQQISGHFLLAVISNIHLYAGGLAEVSPDARLDDGFMDLWLFKGETLGDTVQRMWDLFSGRHLQSDQVLRYSIQSLTLDSDSELFLQMDGEPTDQKGPIQVEVRPKALKVLIPETTPRSLFNGRK